LIFSQSPVLSCMTQFCLILPLHYPSCPALPCPVVLRPVLFYTARSYLYPILSCPSIPSSTCPVFRALSHPIPSCPGCIILFCPALSYWQGQEYSTACVNDYSYVKINRIMEIDKIERYIDDYIFKIRIPKKLIITGYVRKMHKNGSNCRIPNNDTCSLFK
jgi:hypothetical protein